MEYERFNEFLEDFEKWVRIGNEGGKDRRGELIQARRLHIETIQRLKDVGLQSIVKDAVFLDKLYKTLKAWQCNRGGNLVNFDIFVNRIRRKHGIILKLGLEDLSKLAQGCEHGKSNTVNLIWEVLWDMHVAAKSVQLVCGSKTLHHMLPELVPPVDRKRTLRFFFNNTSIRSDPEEQRDKFEEVFDGYIYIYRMRHDVIERLTNTSSWNSSVTKTIDNAINGYREYQKRRQN